MALYPVFNLDPIAGTECIGDSRVKINSNLEGLSASANFACMAVTQLSGKWDSSTAYSPNEYGGFIKLASGIVIQWGKVIIGTGGIPTDQGHYVQFPYQGMSYIFNITTSHVINGANSSAMSAPCSILNTYNTQGFTLVQDTVGTNSVSEMWMAIGA